MRFSRPKLQFGLVALFAVVTLAALVSHWFAVRRRVTSAEDEYRYVREGFDVGVKTKEDIHQASLGWFTAGVAVPFSDKRLLYRAHAERMAELEGYFRGMADIAMLGHIERFEKEADEVAVWRREAEGMLLPQSRA